MKEATRAFLIENRDEAYRDFSKALIPGEVNMLGVRLPVLRRKAKELATGNWKEELRTEDLYFEEVMLRGMMLSYAKGNLDEMLPYIKDFIPMVDNWSVCDSVFSKMNVFRTDREKTWGFIQPYLYSDREFEVRTGIIIMMQHLLRYDACGNEIKRFQTIACRDCMAEEGKKGAYLSRILQALDREFSQYYASMAAAWTITEAFCCYPARVYAFLQERRMDDQTYCRALQKIAESRIPQREVKDRMRQMKRERTKLYIDRQNSHVILIS